MCVDIGGNEFTEHLQGTRFLLLGTVVGKNVWPCLCFNPISAAFQIVCEGIQQPVPALFCQDKTQLTVDLPVLLKLQRKVKELEQEKQSLWQQLDKREEAQQEKAKVWT